MASIVLFNKPFQVLSQFSDPDGRRTLADYLQLPGYRAAGRLDYDSEGLLLLTDNGRLQQQIANPRHKLWKTYLVQVEGDIDETALGALAAGVELKDGPTLPARASRVEPPVLWPRNPPVRERKSVPDSWLELSIREGRNRQVRRMTAAVGLPTLRLVRTRIGDWSLAGLDPGEHRLEQVHLATRPAGAANKRHQRKRR
ncbi:pseudouridine synthase [Seongchinamella sediminis]|uniref:Pseudouridine synthase n=1 Tax=Seongchinamella sediminis TaxID=2283635 RepID=A0A3L7DVG5_9GAMM|nr:pseudouridine synthase [Seongchinamella sediminis]RLQ20590.1 pseudouridine synthase [Seongchinamella sediminis]